MNYSDVANMLAEGDDNNAASDVGGTDFQSLVAQKADEYGVPRAIALSLANHESGFNPSAQSHSGAYGIMQLMPDTARELGVDPTDPVQNIDGGMRYLADNIKRFGVTGGVAAYQAGPGAIAKNGGMPVDASDGLSTNHQYVNAVLGGAKNFGGFEPSEEKPAKSGGLTYTDMLQGYDGGTNPQDDFRDKALASAITDTQNDKSAADIFAIHVSKGVADTAHMLGNLTGIESLKGWSKDKSEELQNELMKDPDTRASMQDYANAKGFWGTLGALKDHPDLMAGTVGEMVAPFLATLPLAAVGGEAGAALMATKAGTAIGRVAGLGAEQAAALGSQVGATFGSSASFGAEGGASAYSNIEETLIKGGMDPEQAHQEAKSGATQVAIITTLLSMVGAGRAAAKMVTGGMASVKQTLGSAAINTAEAGASGGAMMAAQAGIEASKARLVDPNAQADFGKAIAEGGIPGLMLGAAGEGRASLHNLGKEEFTIPPAPEPQKPADIIKPDVNPDEIMARMANAPDANSAISVFMDSMKDTDIKVSGGVPVDSMARVDAIRSMADTDVIRNMLGQLDPVSRQDTLQHLSNATSADPRVLPATKAVSADHIYGLLEQSGGVDEAQRQITARNLEGTMEEKAAIADANDFMGKQEWQQFAANQPENVRTAIDTQQRLVNDASQPESVRAASAKRLMDFASGSGVGKEAPAPKPTIEEKVNAATDQLAQNRTELQTLSGTPAWKEHLASLPAAERTAVIEKMAIVSNPAISDSYRNSVSAELLHSAEAAGVRTRPAEEAAVGTPPPATPRRVTTPEEASRLLSTTKLPEGFGTVTLTDPTKFNRGNLTNVGGVTAGQARVVQMVGRAFGRDVMFFEQNGHTKNVDGFVLPENERAIFLNRNQSGSASLHAVFGHELTHTLPEDIKQKFIDAVSKATDSDRSGEMRDYINQPSLDAKGTMEEVSADLFGNGFNKPELLQKVLDQMPVSAVQKLLQHIRTFVSTMVDRLRGIKDFDTSKFVTDMQSVEKAWVDAVGEHLRRENEGRGMIDGRNASDLSMEELSSLVGMKDHPHQEKAEIEVARRSTYPDYESVGKLSDAAGKTPSGYVSPEPMAKGQKPIEAPLKDRLKEQLDARRKQKSGELLTSRELEVANAPDVQKKPDAKIAEPDRRFATQSEANYFKRKNRLESLVAVRDGSGFVLRRSTADNAAATEKLAEAAGKKSSGYVAPEVPSKPEPKPITLDTKLSVERERPDEMSTIVPTSKNPSFDPVKGFGVIGLKAMKADPKSFDKNVANISGYPNYKPTKSANTPDKQAESFINEVKKNILFLHDQMPAELRDRAKLWYDGARNIVDRWQRSYGIEDGQLAGAIAVLSPQKDWFMNLSLAQRVLDAMHSKQDFAWSPEMSNVAARIYAGEDGMKIADAISGKRLGELKDVFEKAAWIRAHDEAHNSRSYNIVSPEGGYVGPAMNGSGNEATAAWGSLREIAKAVSVIEDGSVANISAMLGSAHKVRNFYNNILTPDSKNGHVTIDTHAVAAGLLRPLSGRDVEVMQNFGSGGAAKSLTTGISGTYGFYAEAYRRAAAERGILPREMQSITWEGVRGLFTKTFKRFRSEEANIDGMWEAYRKGKASYEATRDAVIEAAGGIDRPSWDGPGRVVDAEEGNPTEQGKLPESGVPERSAGPAASGDSGGSGRGAVASVERPSILFEVAPDPNNRELTDRWNKLSSDKKFEVSQKVAERMVPQMLRAVGVKGEMKEQLGGYMGETNPSFSIALSENSSPAQIERAAKVAGYMLSQDSMMVVSPKKIEGSDRVGIISISLPKDSSPEFVSDVYKKLYEIEDGVLQGHTTVDGNMAIIDFSGRTKELGELVNQKLGGEYTVETDTGYASFIDKKEYGYGSDTSSTGEATTSGSPLRDTANRLRTEASATLESELGSARLSADRGDGRPGVDGEGAGQDRQGDAGGVRDSEGYGVPRKDAVRVEATHFSKQPREVLDSSKYGTGMKGAEARRIDNSFDDRLRNRTYFYVDEGTGVKPESGVGASRHDVALNNLYDMRADPLKLYNGDANKFESAVLDHGFDGYYVKKAFGDQGAAVLLGEHRVPVSRDAKLSTPRNQVTSAWNADEPSKMDDFIYTMQDKHIDTKRVVNAINDQVGKIDEKWNPYMKEALYHGRTAEQTKDFLRYEMRPLLQTMTASGVKIGDLNEYLQMRHAPERNAQIANINPSMPDAGSGVSTADAKAYMKSLSPDKAGKLAALAKRVDAMTKQTRDLLVSSGLETADTVRNWESTYQNYVPLMREDVGPEKLGIGSGFSVRGKASKRAMGSDKPVADILAHVAMMRERTIIRAEKNRVSQALYGLAVQNPNTDYWLPVSSAKDLKSQQDMLVNMGLNPIDAKSLIDEPTQRYIDPTTGLVESRINPALRGAENVLSMRIDGKDHFLFFNESNERSARMVRSLKNLDADQMGRVLSTAGQVTRYIAAINTQYNPFFGVLNIMRDTGEAALNLTTTPIAGRQREVVSNIPAAVRGVYLALRDERSGKQVHSSWGKLFKEFADAGGKTGYKDMFTSSEDRAKALQSEIAELSSGKAKQVKRAVLGLLDDFNEALENGTRLAAYKAGRDNGMSIDAAASMAKDLTVNFNRKGKIAPQAGALFAFFNASAQGTARLVETMKGPAGKKILAGGLVLGAMQAVMMGAAGIDKDVPEFVKQNNIIIPTGGKSYLSIPIPLGFRIIPGVARMLTEFVMNGFKDPTGTLANAIGLAADSFNPIGNAGLSVQTIAPTFADPLVALAENRDWTGKPIAKKDFNSLSPTPGSSRYYDTASSVGKLVSKAINGLTGGSEFRPGMLSPTPDQIDFLIGQVTGGVGREALKAEQTASAALSGEAISTSKIPLVGRFYGNASDQSGMSTKFYDNIVKLNELDAEVKGRMKNKEDYRGFIADNPEYKLAAMADRSEREVASLRKMKRKLVESGNGGSRVAALDQRINAVMSRLNEKVESMTGD